MTTTTEHDVKQQAEDLYRTTMDYLVAKKDEFQDTLERQVGDIEKRVSDWKKKADSAASGTSRSMKEEADEVERRAERFKHRLAIYKSSTESAAADAKKGLEHAAVELREGLRNAGSRFRK